MIGLYFSALRQHYLESSQVGTLERADKIRTYNFQQDRISDHRINMTLFGVDSFLGGSLGLDEMLTELAECERREKLLELFENFSSDLKSKNREKVS